MNSSFCPGSEWLYYKIYAGVKTANIILLENLYPIIWSLQNEGMVDKWFFIRYNDPDAHLRIRLHFRNSEQSATAMLTFQTVLQPLQDAGNIWNVQVDTYKREIERYGEQTIGAAETLFYYDSEAIIEYIALKPDFNEEETQLIFSMVNIERFLQAFGMQNKDKMGLMNQLQMRFKEEFHAGKTLKKELDRHYRKHSDKISCALDFMENKDCNAFFNIVNRKEKAIMEVVESIKLQLQIPLQDFIESHIHMMINRQYTSQQRKYECVVYDHLHRYYKMKQFKNN